jgi:hypothetical protein
LIQTLNAIKITEHDEVGRISVHVLGIERAVEELGVSAAAVDVLFVLDCELKDEGLVLVGEGLELGGGGVELSVLAGLNTLALFGIAVKLSGCQNELAGIAALVCRRDPSFFPRICWKNQNLMSFNLLKQIFCHFNHLLSEAGGTFDNSFVLVRQMNRSFLLLGININQT